MFSNPQVKNMPPMMLRTTSSLRVSKGLRPFRPGLDRKPRLTPRYSNSLTSRALSSIATNLTSPFLTSMARIPAARPSS